MIRVLFDHQIFSLQKYGGISRYFANLYHSAVIDSRINPFISILYSENYYLEHEPNLLVKLFGRRFFTSQKKIYKWNKKYSKRVISLKNFDLFHPTYYEPYFLKQIKNRPFVITIHDMIHELFPENFNANDQTIMQKKICIEKASHIIAISNNTKNDLIVIYNVDPKKITVIHHGIDLNHKPAYKGIEKLPEDYILFVGDRKGYKNFKIVAEAFSALQHDFKNLNLILAGGRVLSEEEIGFLKGKNIFDKIHHKVVSDEELNTLYKNARCFIFPSLYEGFGYPILEAFLNDCPTVLSRCSCFEEIAGNDAVLYFDGRSCIDLENKVRMVLQNKDNCVEKMKVAGRSKVQEYSLETSAKKTFKVYRSVLNDHD